MQQFQLIQDMQRHTSVYKGDNDDLTINEIKNPITKV